MKPIFLVALVLGLAPLAHADSLFSVPTAQEPDKGEVQFSLEQDTDRTSFRSPDTLRLATVEYGLFKRLSVGFDAELVGRSRVRPNISLLLTRDKAPVSAAIGFQNVGVRSFGEQPYAVLSRDFGGFSLHGGATHDSEGTHGMLGLEKPLGKRFEIVGDYIGGRGNYATVGGQLQIGKNLQLAAGWMFANSHDDSNGLFLSLERDIH